MQHYHHSIATEAKKLEQPLPKLESDLSAHLDTNVDDVSICFLHLSVIYMHFACIQGHCLCTENRKILYTLSVFRSLKSYQENATRLYLFFKNILLVSSFLCRHVARKLSDWTHLFLTVCHKR